MKASKQKTDNDPAAAESVDSIRAELETAEAKLAQVDPHRGTVDSVLEQRRPLQERIAILRERLQLAEQRAAEAEYAEAERRIDELMEQAQQIEVELVEARERAAADLREHLNPDWLDGRGRYSSERPALGGLLGFCNCVSEVEARRDAVQAAIRSRENRIAERKAARDREAAAARADARRKLIGGDAVAVDLVPWRVECLAGFIPDVLDGLDRKFIPAALVDPRACEIHCLLPPETTPQRWIDGGHIESAEQMDPTALCPAMAGVWARATPSKKRASR